jgi:hypothetical protein
MKEQSWFEGRCSTKTFQELASMSHDQILQAEAGKFKDGCVTVAGAAEKTRTYYCHIDNCNEYYSCDYSPQNLAHIGTTGIGFIVVIAVFAGFVAVTTGTFPKREARAVAPSAFPPYGVGVSGGYAEIAARGVERGFQSDGSSGHSDRLNP